MLRLEVNRLVNAFSVLHLLGLIAVGNRTALLDAVYTRVTLRIGRRVVEVNRVCLEQIHLVLTRLAEAGRIDMRKLKWLRHADLTTLTRSYDAGWVVRVFGEGETRCVQGVYSSKVIVTR